MRVMKETTRLKKTIPRARGRSGCNAERPASVGGLGLAVEDRVDQTLHLGRDVLAVGVERDDDLDVERSAMSR